MLKIRDLHINCGNLHIIQGVSMEVREGDVVSLMGSNGVGKTTLMRAVSGLGKIVSGTVEFMGEDITHWQAERIVRAGLIQVPEGRKLFPLMNVMENLMMGAAPRRARARVRQNLERVFGIFPELREIEKIPAGNLSGGQQQMVAIGRGLMADPKLLLLDEPSIGLSPIMSQKVVSAVAQINREGVAVLIAEQNIFDILKIAQYAYVLQGGKVVKCGTAQEILTSAEIASTYLGYDG